MDDGRAKVFLAKTTVERYVFGPEASDPLVAKAVQLVQRSRP